MNKMANFKRSNFTSTAVSNLLLPENRIKILPLWHHKDRSTDRCHVLFTRVMKFLLCSA